MKEKLKILFFIHNNKVLKFILSTKRKNSTTTKKNQHQNKTKNISGKLIKKNTLNTISAIDEFKIYNLIKKKQVPILS